MTAYIILAAYNFISEGRAFTECIETDVVPRAPEWATRVPQWKGSSAPPYCSWPAEQTAYLEHLIVGFVSIYTIHLCSTMNANN